MYRRKHGLPPLEAIERPELKKLDRKKFNELCRDMGKPITIIIELAGSSRNNLGAYYNRGAGPETRRRLCEYLGVEESELWIAKQ